MTAVLVGGGGLAPWVWSRVTPILQPHGMRVVTPQLRATGDDATTPAQVTLDDWIDDLVAAIDAEAEVTLVAHSFAGYVAAGALGRMVRNVRAVLFVDAVLPVPGASWFQTMGAEVEEFMRSIARNGATPWFTRQQLDAMYAGHGFSHADMTWMEEHVTPQPLGTFTQVATDRPIASLAPDVALHYLRCTRTSPPAASITSATPGWSFSTLDSSHWPMVTAPDALSRSILAL